MSLLGELIETGHVEPIETVIRAKDGREIPMSVTYSLIKDDEGNPTNIVALLRDITELKRLQEREKEVLVLAERAATIDAMVDGVLTHDLEGKIISANKSLEDMAGYKKEEYLGKSLFEFVKPEELEKARAELAELLAAGKAGPRETILFTKDGREIPIQTISSLMKDAQGNPIYGIVVIRDITEHKRMQEQLLRSERLSTIGQLAGGVGHDLRTPLAALKNSIYFLNKHPELDEKYLEHFDLMEESLDQAILTVEGLLDYARVPRVTPVAFRYSDLVDEVLGQTMIPSEVIVERCPPEKSPEVIADKGHISRVISNIVTNAIEAMPKGGKLSFHCGAITNEGFVEVVDTGEGITKEDLSQIFEPLFTRRAKGMGLGLAIAKHYVELSKGRIEVESELGQGSVFRVLLPATGAESS